MATELRGCGVSPRGDHIIDISAQGTTTNDELMRVSTTLWCCIVAMDETVNSTRYIWVFLFVAALPLSAHAMSRYTAVSAGSFFAAAARCEAHSLITSGQTDALMKALKPYLSSSDQHNMQSGYIRGEKDSTVYVVQEKRWAPFSPDSSSCYRVQGVLDDYKAQLDAD